MRRGEIIERFDPHFHLPDFKTLVETIKATGYSSIGNLISFSSEVWNQSLNTFGTEFPYIEISAVDLQSGEYVVNNVLLNEAPSRAKMIVRDSDIIVSMTRPNRGAIAKIKAEHDGYIASTGFAIVRETKATIDRDYLYYALKSSLTLDQLLQRSSGGNYPAITQDEIEKVLIPLPDLDTQRALVVDMESARAIRQIKLAKAESLLAEIDGFVLDELGLIVKDTKERKNFAIKFSLVRKRFDVDYHTPRFRKLRELISNTQHNLMTIEQVLSKAPVSGFAAGRADQAEDETVGIPHVRPFNITPNGEFSLATIKFVPNETVSDADLLQNGDVLFNNTNSTQWVGKTTVFDDKQKCACSNHITRLTVNPDIANPYFIASLFNALRSLGLFGLLSTNFNNQAGVNNETLTQLQIPVPDMKIQKKIVAELQRRRAQARQLREEAEREWQNAKENFEKVLLG